MTRARAAAIAILCCAMAARADDPVPVSNDGLWLTIGPVGGAVRVEGDWFSAFGLEGSVVYLRERRLPALIGGSFGGMSYAGRGGGRFWLEAEIAVNDPLPFAIGLGFGPAAELGRSQPTHLGIQGTLWVFAGVLPYIRAGALEQTGGFVEIGILIKVPAIRFP